MAAKKVFSKHNAKDIREWSKQLMESYQLLHAIEKPMNLSHIQTEFANTSDLKDLVPAMVKPGKKKSDEEKQKAKMNDPDGTIDLDEQKRSWREKQEES